ncbi:membrane protein insertion efficiency factor YidD [Pedobacter vanadiisoli]|uniref:Membrane protein insertion efficiency factor YidD n=1 Tax=Pedobacter vanadiisoli TaxID=1761975 RepID=A0ABW5MRH4_9SPHI
MKIILLSLIRIYWAVFPKNKRYKCIFRLSCSKHVYQVTEQEGLLEGFKALKYRYRNCRNGFHLFKNHVDDSMTMILPEGNLLLENEISERFIKT